MKQLTKVLTLLRVVIITALAAFMTLTGCSQGATQQKASGSPDQHTVRIGYQKFGTLNILKAQGTLEKRLKSLGVSVEWIQFPAGPQLLEAMHVGSIDIGHTGEAPLSSHRQRTRHLSMLQKSHRILQERPYLFLRTLPFGHWLI